MWRRVASCGVVWRRVASCGEVGEVGVCGSVSLWVLLHHVIDHAVVVLVAGEAETAQDGAEEMFFHIAPNKVCCQVQFFCFSLVVFMGMAYLCKVNAKVGKRVGPRGPTR